MSDNYVLMRAELPPESKPDIHLFIILANDVSIVHFDKAEDPDVYYLEDVRLEDKTLWKNTHAFFHLFAEDMNVPGSQGKRIVVIHYNLMVAQCVREYLRNFEHEKRIQWHALSFFHNDEDTKNLGLAWPDVILAKVYIIDSLNLFPWVKKLEVPPGEYFYHRDLLKLVLDDEDFKELDDEDEQPYVRRGNDKPPQLFWSSRPPDRNTPKP